MRHLRDVGELRHLGRGLLGVHVGRDIESRANAADHLKLVERVTELRTKRLHLQHLVSRHGIGLAVLDCSILELLVVLFGAVHGLAHVGKGGVHGRCGPDGCRRESHDGNREVRGHLVTDRRHRAANVLHALADALHVVRELPETATHVLLLTELVHLVVEVLELRFRDIDLLCESRDYLGVLGVLQRGLERINAILGYLDLLGHDLGAVADEVEALGVHPERRVELSRGALGLTHLGVHVGEDLGELGIIAFILDGYALVVVLGSHKAIPPICVLGFDL